jgi:hypothetical protein
MKHRPFGLTDAMLLVVAVAVALSVNRADWRDSFYWSLVNSYDSIKTFLILALPHVAAITVALVAIRMRKPRPALRRLARHPGAVACMVALAALLLVVVWAATIAATGRILEYHQHVDRLPNGGGHGVGGSLRYPDAGRWLTVYGDRVGFSVAGAWLSLVLAGRWRPEPTWIDRFGRAVGWLWLSLTVALWLRSLLL